jgi:hypothetical protein
VNTLDEEVRVCPCCGARRPPTGPGFCNTYCEFVWGQGVVPLAGWPDIRFDPRPWYW